MDKNIWLSGAILIAIILLAVVAFVLRKKGRASPDYKSFFYIGLVWMALGLTTMRDNYFFFLMGVVSAVLGLSHKKGWEKNHRRWNELGAKEKRIKIGVTITLAFLIAAGIAILLVK